ncbi:MAG: SDR family oxidoreductase, partial [Bacteriovoracaceae bacterium]|nr:SDR family oxidoreductase [Bacteriovoracaceae bacterium]
MSEKFFITGVHGGIGKNLVLALINKGHKVIGSDIHDSPKEELKLSGYYSLDLSNLESINKTFEKVINDHPDISIVVNNAGIANLMPFLEESENDFQKIMDINFNSLIISTRFWLSHFENKGDGLIANMASMAGHVPPSGICSYSASKHAVVGFTRSLQLELDAISSPVKVSLISPGFIKTDIMQIGKENGFPEKYEYIATSPVVAGEKIAKGLLKREEFIIPDYSGRVINKVNRWAPGILRKSNK